MFFLWNGGSGAIGRCVATAVGAAPHRALRARVEDDDALRAELDDIAEADLDGADDDDDIGNDNVNDSGTGDIALLLLAARVPVPLCERDPAAARRVNVDGAQAVARVVADWARRRHRRLHVVFASTGHVYAPVEEGRRLRESDVCGPRSTYARTKLDGERAVCSVVDGRASVTVARVFGVVGVDQGPAFVLPSLIRRARARDVSAIPGLDSARDYLDARDVADHLVGLARARCDGVVNVCSGRPVRIRELLDEVCRALGSDAAAGATPGPPRADDVPWIVGDPARLEALVGPATRRPLALTVREAVARAQESTTTS